MVFPSATDVEKQQQTPDDHNQIATMTSSPDVKSHHQQPLPNLPVQGIIRSKKRNSTRRVVRKFAGESSSRMSPLRKTGSDGAPVAPSGFPRTETPPLEKKSSDAAAPKKIGKFFIRLRPKSSTKPADDVAVAVDAGKQDSNAEAAEVPGLEPEAEPELRNLRPRQPVNKKPKVHAGALEIGGPASPPGTKVEAPSRPELILPLNARDAKLAAAEKKENEEEKEEDNEKEKVKEKEKGKQKEKVTKPKLSITLTQQEIEEDIFSLTGSRLSRKPKKRAKDVQKALDRLFPGTCLCDVTPDSYKVQEPHIKG